MVYQSFALLRLSSDLDLDVATERLSERLRHMRVLRRINSIELVHNGWSIQMDLVSDPHVLVESALIAQHYGEERPDREDIAACACRLEIYTDSDPGNGYFSDYAAALNVLHGLGKVILFDPVHGGFL